MYLVRFNLFVDDFVAMRDFYKAAFRHWCIRRQGEGVWYVKARKWLHFGDDFQYLALSDNGEQHNRDLTGHQIGLAHFAYVTNNIAAVISRLEDAGCSIDKPGAENPFRKNVYFIYPAGFEVDFVEYLSDIPNERNNDL